MSETVATKKNILLQQCVDTYGAALHEIISVLEDSRADDAEKVRTIRRILRAIGMTTPKE